MTIYSIKGKIIDSKSGHDQNYKIQALDSDKQFFEDHNDDLLGSAWTDHDKSFKITFDDLTFKDNWLEQSPEIYLIIRNRNGQIIHQTEIIKIDRNGNNKDLVEILFTINLDSIKPKKELLDIFNGDDYSFNTQRILSSFSSLGDVVTLNNSNAARNFQLLISSVNAWLNYTNELSWKRIGYDGPQVPRYPNKSPNHSHKLDWEK